MNCILSSGLSFTVYHTTKQAWGQSIKTNQSFTEILRASPLSTMANGFDQMVFNLPPNGALIANNRNRMLLLQMRG
jgi:hypothetical protein